MTIDVDDLTGNDMAKFLTEHLRGMGAVSPPESMHALNVEELRDASVTFWAVRENDIVIACCAHQTA